jgi:flagellar protein FliS
MTLEKKQELTLKITQANKTQMITILYEMVTIYLSEAIDHIEAGETAEADRSLMSAQNCIDELIHSLNLDYELGRNLHEIYIFSKKELVAAGATGAIDRIKRVLKNFDKLHEAYLELEKQDTSEGLMGNTQKVYAGLTYGKHALNEDMTASSTNRGFMA